MMDEPVVGMIIRNYSRTEQTPTIRVHLVAYKSELERLVTGVLARGVATGDLRGGPRHGGVVLRPEPTPCWLAWYPSLGERRPEVAELISEVVVRGLAVDRDDDQALARAGRRT